MNERIKELESQCWVPMKHGPAWFNGTKFAELIVAHATECVRDVLRDEKSDLSYAAASQVQDHIKQYFGVEE